MLGAGASVRGFQARYRRNCRTCPDKECLRGSDRAYGCPWGTWPGGTSSNVDCGLCGECFRSCSRDNVGLFWRERLDVGAAVLSRAIGRGELPPHIDADLLIEAFLAPIYLRVLFSQEPVSAEFLAHLIDVLLDGALSAGV